VGAVASLGEDLFAVFILHLFVGMSFMKVVWCVICVWNIIRIILFSKTEGLLTHTMRAVILVVRLALRALHAGLNLSTNTNTVSDLAS